jgi:hypothetical protein
MKFSTSKIACFIALTALSFHAPADSIKNPAGFFVNGNMGVGMDGWRRWEGSTLQYRNWSDSDTISNVKHDFRFAYGSTMGYSFNDKFAIQGEFRKMQGNTLTIDGRKVDTSNNDLALLGQMSMPIGNIYLDADLGFGAIYSSADLPLGNHSQWLPVLGIGDHMMISKHFSAGISYRYFMSIAHYNYSSYTPSHQYLTVNIGYHFNNAADDGDTNAVTQNSASNSNVATNSNNNSVELS